MIRNRFALFKRFAIICLLGLTFFIRSGYAQDAAQQALGEVSVSTDKEEYFQGETSLITIFNNTDKPIYYQTDCNIYVVFFDRVETAPIIKYPPHRLQKASHKSADSLQQVSHEPVCGFMPASLKEIKPQQLIVVKMILAACSLSNPSALCFNGMYKARFHYYLDKGSFPQGESGPYKEPAVISVHSKEFRVKKNE